MCITESFCCTPEANDRLLINCTPGTSLVAQWMRIHCRGRGYRFDPWSRKIPHTEEQLSPDTTRPSPSSGAWEPQLLSLCVTTTEAREPRVCALLQERPQK